MRKFRPGVSFSDFVVTDSAKSSFRTGQSTEIPSLGVGVNRWVWAITLAALGLLLVRLLVLQVFLGSRNRLLADQNRIKQIRIAAPRGKILDRHGATLAGNTQVADGFARDYPLGAAASAVVGFLGEAGESEVGLVVEPGEVYELGSFIGRAGIEKQYEQTLRGRDGGRLVEVDNAGGEVRQLGSREPQPGTDITLSLEGTLQQVAHLALMDKKGAVVVSNPQTGEVLALASTPANEFNRAIGGVYPPGSTFKMVTTLAALEDNKLESSFTYTDTGNVQVGDFSYTNWYFTQYGRTEGVVGWEKSLARSVDTFFYKVGEYTGAETIAKWAQTLGFGPVTGIDIPGEVGGLIPTPAWKQEIKKEAWFLGNTYHLAIGQGDMLATPLQVNLMTNILASRGKKCKPHVVKDQKPECTEIEINNDYLDLVKSGMIGACSEGGTAFPLFSLNQGETRVACKTGTAEYVRADGKIGTHAWLTAFAPVDNPTISVTVLVEAGGEGSRVAAPIARQVLVKYLGVPDKFNYAAVAGEGE